jgi:hypothetical protein
MTKKLFEGALNNLYLILLFLSISYFVLYTILIFNKEYLGSWENKDYWLEFFKNIALIVFSAGIFTSSLKYLQYIKVFEKEFERILLSQTFHSKIKESVESITYSNEHLLKQSDLDKIWKRVTLSKYKQRFPELMNQLTKNLENELFEENNLVCYYKNFQMNVNFELLKNNLVKITERSHFSVVSNSEEEVKIIFWVSSANKGNENGCYTKIIPENTKIDGKIFDINSFNSLEEISENGIYIKKFEFILSGKSTYHIERCVEMTQNLNDDRVYSFSSSKIIDDLTVNIQYCSDLNVYFSKVGKNTFNNIGNYSNGISLSNRDVLLPGEKFKVFIYKK